MENAERQMRLSISGMSCVNCQNKIEKTLRGTKGIVHVSVRYNDGTADLVYDSRKISPEQIQAVIEKLGYRAMPEQKPDVLRTICLLLILISLYVLLQTTGVLNLLAPGRLADGSMSGGMLFVIGLITSVHCVAMCGGINLSQCLPQGEETESSGKLTAFLPALSYNLGRVVAYTGMGGVLGLLGLLLGDGAETGLSSLLQGLLKMAAGVFMVIMGINMLGLFPSLRRLTIRMPQKLVRRIGQGQKRFRGSRPFLVGFLNGFMPCGPLQSMWIVALGAGNPLTGALSMLLFSLGTVPLMLGLGSIVTALGRKFTDTAMTVGAVLVVVLGLAMLSQGGSLSGLLAPERLLLLLLAFCIAGVLLTLPVRKKTKQVIRVLSMLLVLGAYVLGKSSVLVPETSADSGKAVLMDGVQVVDSTLSPGQYPSITVKKGIPVHWVIDAPEGSINGCNYKMLIRDFDLEYTFHVGENVLEFTPNEAGTVPYSCWMGMIFGSIYVVDE